MRKALLIALLAVAPAAWAQAPQNTDSQPSERFEQFEAKHVQKMAAALGLDDAGAARIKAAFDTMRTQGKAIREQAKPDMQILRQAADGDASAQGQVDAALARLKTVHQQEQQLRSQFFDTVAQGLNAQQKAKFALMVAHHMHGKGRMGHGRHFGAGGVQQQP